MDRPTQDSVGQASRPAEGVEALLLELLERGGDTDQVLTDLCSRHPEHADALRRRVRALSEAGLLGPTPATVEPLIPESLGDFQLIERLGAGGMGVVFRARQRSLGREVALKLVRPELLFFEGGRERFRREVETVARLSHPGIVPVYAVGEEHGIPFFAMELVPGATLSDTLQRLDARSHESLTGRDLERALCELCGEEPSGAALFAGTWEETCLRIAREVAEALEHAHRRGVLHRDVKPSNVMLTPAGRVLLVDFGLARQEGVSDVTASGALVGSLPYMAPEVLEGARPDRRVDVYALGVLLYRLVALRAPFEGAQPELLRKQIVAGTARPLRRANAHASWEVEAICSVAIDRDPARRYASAGAFAEDLTCALEHRPVAARPAGPARLLARWIQRNPGGALAAALALAVVTLGPTLFALQQSRARTRLQAQYERADRNLQRAFEAVDLLTTVATEELKDVPMAEEGRRQLLVAACKYYEDLVQQDSSGPAQDLERARALLKLGGLRDELDDMAGSESALREGIAMLERLEVDRLSPRFAGELAHAHWYLGRALARTDRSAEGIEVLRAGLALLEPHPAEGKDLVLPAQLRCELARALDRRNESAEVGDLCRKVIEDLHDQPVGGEERTARLLEAFAHTLLQKVEDLAGDHDAAFGHAQDALAVYTRASEQAPSDRELLQHVVVANSNMGQGQLNLGRAAEAVPYLEKAVEVGEKLVRDFPGIPRYRYHLAGSLLNLGVAQLKLDDPHATESMETAVDHLSTLVAQAPDILAYRSMLVAAEGNLGALLIHQGDEEEALDRLEHVASVIEDTPAPRSGEMNTALRYSRINRIKADIRLGRLDDALAVARTVAGDDDAFCLHTSALLLAAALAPDRCAAARREDTSAIVFELLTKAIDCGLKAPDALEQKDLETLSDDPRLAELRERYAQRRSR